MVDISKLITDFLDYKVWHLYIIVIFNLTVLSLSLFSLLSKNLKFIQFLWQVYKLRFLFDVEYLPD